jgi:hypothetical protein
MSGNILILNRWPQYPDGARWDNELARYGELISHVDHQVTYICDTAGQQGVTLATKAPVHVHVVQDFADGAAVLELVDTLILRAGRFDHVIAFSEYLLDLAAVIRERHGIQGPKPAEVDRFRDKTVMKSILAAAGIRVPRWFPCPSAEQAQRDAATLGFPLILKPKRGASSKGVRRIGSAAELATICAGLELAEHEIEEYIEGDVFHADGVVDRDGRCIFMSVSRYIAPCLAFESGASLGSIIQTDPALCEECRRFALRCLAALGLRASAFHLEFFKTGRELVFLEIGARVPSADVSYVIHDVYGVNLFKLWIDVMLGRDTAVPRGPGGAASGGWLTIPRPLPLPRKVIAATPLLGKIPLLYRELVPRPGEVLEDVGGYANLQGGRFLFRGGSAQEVAAAIHAAESQYMLETAQL